MKTTIALLLATAAYVSAQQRVCSPTELVFVFDHSEKASKAFTPPNQPTQTFQILEQAWRRVLAEISDNYLNVDIRFWVIGYSSTGQILVERNSNLLQANARQVGNVMSSGGSWTYQGLELIGNARPTPNMGNTIILVSAGGSFDPEKQNRSRRAYQILSGNGWNTRVIAVLDTQGSPTNELPSLTRNRLQIITNGNQIGDALSQAIRESITCRFVTPRPTTRRPFPTRPIQTAPPRGGICSSCKRSDSDSNFYDSHSMCDGYYQCLPDKSYVEMGCGEGLWFDSERLICDYPKNVICATARCDVGMTARYPSKTCCNKYFQCTNGVYTYEKCPSGQTFDANSQSCRVSNVNSVCKNNYCNERLSTTVNNCDGQFAPDTTGNPCQFYHAGVLLKTAAGTRWYQPNCTQILAKDGCSPDLLDRALGLSTECTALVLSTFDSNSKMVYSQRIADLDLFVDMLNVSPLQNALVFNHPNPVVYYPFFANNELQTNSAIRMVFKLDASAQNGVTYDLFSNNFCVECPETIGATVSRNGNSYRIVTRLTDSTTKSVVSTTTDVTPNQTTDPWLDLRLIWGLTEVYGQVNILDANKRFVRAVTIERVRHRGNANILPNKCGILLGAGANTAFKGMVDEFAYYRSCANIDDVLQIRNSVVF